MDNTKYETAFKQIIEMEKKYAPLLVNVLEDLNWHEHIVENGRKPWITCRDRKGNRYTLFPQYDNQTLLPDNFTIYRHRD
jgi:hypothetical protein